MRTILIVKGLDRRKTVYRVMVMRGTTMKRVIALMTITTGRARTCPKLLSARASFTLNSMTFSTQLAHVPFYRSVVGMKQPKMV